MIEQPGHPEIDFNHGDASVQPQTASLRRPPDDLIKTGDCADPSVQESHAQFMVSASSWMQSAHAVLEQLPGWQSTMCEKLDRLESMLSKTVTQAMEQNHALDITLRDVTKTLAALQIWQKEHDKLHAEHNRRLSDRIFRITQPILTAGLLVLLGWFGSSLGNRPPVQQDKTVTALILENEKKETEILLEISRTMDDISKSLMKRDERP